MLYDRWRRIAQSRANQLALQDLATDRRWTFGQLFSSAEALPQTEGRLVWPRGLSAEFVLETLRAWHYEQVVCPLEASQAPPPLAAKLPSKLVHLKTTSASTGTPRLIAFTAAQLMADADNIVETMGLRPDWPNLAVISLAHSYGFSNLVLPLLLHGIPLILVGSALPEAVRHAAQEHPDLTLAAVPALWQTWLEAGAIPANVRLAISAGAPLPVSLEQAVYEKHGLKIHNFYGSSECGGIAYDHSTLPRTDSAYAGSALANVALSIAEDGCVEVRSNAVAETYWPEPSPQLGQGLFHTRDVARLVDGNLVLCGRASDQINVAGRKVLPETIEAVLSTHPQVRSCLAFGVPSSDPQRGETIVACVVASSLSPEALRQFALEHLPSWQVPREWWMIEKLEANGRGKLSRAEWRKRYLELGRSGSPLKVNSPRMTS